MNNITKSVAAENIRIGEDMEHDAEKLLILLERQYSEGAITEAEYVKMKANYESMLANALELQKSGQQTH